MCPLCATIVVDGSALNKHMNNISCTKIAAMFLQLPDKGSATLTAAAAEIAVNDERVQTLRANIKKHGITLLSAAPP